MKKHRLAAGLLLVRLTRKVRKYVRKSISRVKENLAARKTLDKVGRKLEQWVKEGKHHENYESMDRILDDLGLTVEELSFYCSRVLKKKFLTWRKELRIEESKKLLLSNPDLPACHVGYLVGLTDKSNFRQQFREMVGCTPSEWRERHLPGLEHNAGREQDSEADDCQMM